jgi:general secretion pathway protein F
MPRFRYKAVTPGGELTEGEMDALDRAIVIDQLYTEGHTPIRADEIDRAAATQRVVKGLFGSLLSGHRLSPSDIVLLSQQMATMLRAGLPLDRTLAILGTLADKPATRALINGVLERVRSGATLAEALEQRAGALPSFYVGMVRAGESAGDPAAVLTRLAEILTRAQAVRENIRSAMYYPIIVLIVAGMSIAILLTVVVPEFRPLFENAGTALPTSTKLIIAMGDWLKAYWAVGLAALFAVIVALRLHYAWPTGRLYWDRLMLGLPLVGDVVRKTQTSRFVRTLGSLLASGVIELNALSIAAGTLTNRVIAGAVDDLGARLRKGDGWAVPLREAGVFPGLAIQMVQVGEESGQLDSMLVQVAEIYDEEVKRTLQRLLALLTPGITIVLGLIVALIIGSMLTAILSAYNLAA